MEKAALNAKMKRKEEIKVKAREAKLMKKETKIDQKEARGEDKGGDKSSNEVTQQ